MPDEVALAQQDTDILSALETYEDYLSFYVQIEQNSTAFSWLKADTLYRMSQRLGEKTLTQLARDLKQPDSTVSGYVRVARAFPKDKREPDVSFSIHFHASWADSYDQKNQQFITNKRFNWVKKAAEEQLSVRKVIAGVKEEKEGEVFLAEGEEAKIRQEAKDKVLMMSKLLRDLLKATLRGDIDAFDKIREIYKRIYGK